MVNTKIRLIGGLFVLSVCTLASLAVVSATMKLPSKTESGLGKLKASANVEILKDLKTKGTALDSCMSSAYTKNSNVAALTQYQKCAQPLADYRQSVNEYLLNNNENKESLAVEADYIRDEKFLNYALDYLKVKTNKKLTNDEKIAENNKLQSELDAMIAQNKEFSQKYGTTEFFKGYGGNKSVQSYTQALTKEKNAVLKAIKDAEKAKAAADKKNQPAKTKDAGKLNIIPSESVSNSSPHLNTQGQIPQGTVGQTYDPPYTFTASDGLPPYHFQLDTGGSFPPMGMILSPNGTLSGKPSVAGEKSFRVCVVDTAGKSDCQAVTITIVEPTPPPAPPAPVCPHKDEARSPIGLYQSCDDTNNACQNNIPDDANYYHNRDMCDYAYCQCRSQIQLDYYGGPSCFQVSDCSKVINH